MPSGSRWLVAGSLMLCACVSKDVATDGPDRLVVPGQANDEREGDAADMPAAAGDAAIIENTDGDADAYGGDADAYEGDADAYEGDDAQAHAIDTDAGDADGMGMDSARPSEATPATFLEACERTCPMQSECVGVTKPECIEQCTVRALGLKGDACLAAGMAELECVRGLSCDELRAYSTEGRRDHPTCGAQAESYFADCTIGHGETPIGCRKMCDRDAACSALGGSLSACEEECVLRATATAWYEDQACSAAFLELAACLGEVSCADLSTLRDFGMIPAACAMLYAEMDKVCY